jgi:hypothetical protein
VTEEDVHTLEKAVSKEEIFEILRGFSRDKSLGPDGWTVEFFFNYFELVGQDLLEMVEDSRFRGEVINSINSTFLALIPKVNGPTTFNDFRPIVLCNLCYKIIAKVIAKRISQFCLEPSLKNIWVFSKEDKFWMQSTLLRSVFIALKIKNFKP